MTFKNYQNGDVFWHEVLNCREANYLSAVDERKFLLELFDCKKSILEALPRRDDTIADLSGATTAFHRLIREIADAEETGLNPAADALLCLARRYQEIRHTLAMANLRLVAHVARHYRYRAIPYGDLVQEGFCALLVAIDRFDLVNETRLASYAVWWIRQAMQRAVASGAFPVRLHSRQLQRLMQAQAMAGGRGNYPMARFDTQSAALSPTIEHVLAATRPVLALDAPGRGNDSRALGEFLILADQDDLPDDDARPSVCDLIEELNARQQLVLTLRFGLGGEPPCSLVQVGQVLGVSKERVRQIQVRAIAVLRTLLAGRDVRRRHSHRSSLRTGEKMPGARRA
jgi:RNA polymerase primary sigma factor